MKKILVFLLTGVMVASLTACGGKNNADTNTEATDNVVNTEIATEAVVDTEAIVEDEYVAEVSELEGVISSIYENHAAMELMLGTIPVNIDDLGDPADPEVTGDLEYNTGLKSNENLVEAVRSESMFGSQAYSLVVVKVDDAANAQVVADEMYDNINQRKWVCAEAGDKMVATFGDIVMLIMVDIEYAEVVTAQSIVDAFKAACGGTLDYTR